MDISFGISHLWQIKELKFSKNKQNTDKILTNLDTMKYRELLGMLISYPSVELGLTNLTAIYT